MTDRLAAGDTAPDFTLTNDAGARSRSPTCAAAR